MYQRTARGLIWIKNLDEMLYTNTRGLTFTQMGRKRECEREKHFHCNKTVRVKQVKRAGASRSPCFQLGSEELWGLPVVLGFGKRRRYNDDDYGDEDQKRTTAHRGVETEASAWLNPDQRLQAEKKNRWVKVKTCHIMQIQLFSNLGVNLRFAKCQITVKKKNGFGE